MSDVVFDRQIEAALNHLEELWERASAVSSPPALLSEALAELSTTLQELQVVGEELRQQNEALVAARQTAEVERQRYQDLFDFAPDGYVVTDPEGIIQKANRAAALLLQVRQDFLVGEPLVIFVAEEGHKAFQTQLSRLANVAQLSDWEVRLQPRGGVPYVAALTVAVARDTEGHVVTLRWLIRDITVHKRLEEVLRRERDFAKNLIETAQAIVLVLDTEGRIVRFNPYMEEVSGYRLEEVQGKDWFTTFLPRRDQGRVQETFFKVMSDFEGHNVNPIVTKEGH
ncbi:MAG: PAS domain S-box protein [Deltaproteobacteria bacterium]|nr:PAS domain S-box protein [Deltaproteobacteria bacterium]